MARIYVEELTPTSLARRHSLGGAVAEAVRADPPKEWAPERPGRLVTPGEDPFRTRLAYSSRPRPLGPLPSPPIWSHLLYAEPSPFAHDEDLRGLLVAAPDLYVAFRGLRAARDLLVRLQSPADGPAVSRILGTGLVRVDDPAARLRVLRAVPEAPDDYALVSAPAPAFLTFARPDRQHERYGRLAEGVLWGLSTFPFARLHASFLACEWLLRSNAAGSACLYSVHDLRSRFSGARATSLEALSAARGPRTGPPIPPEIVATLSTAERVDLSGSDVTDLRTLLQAQSLRHLMVDDLPWLDVDTIAELRELRSLSMRGTWVEDLSFLEDLPHLERLSIDVAPVQGWSELERLPHLRHLDLPEGAELPEEVLARLVGVRITRSVG